LAGASVTVTATPAASLARSAAPDWASISAVGMRGQSVQVPPIVMRSRSGVV
jgi:hypothetical protein